MIDFASDSNWLTLYDQLTFSVLGQPIPSVLLTSSYNYRFLRIAANNQNARSTWRLGAHIHLLVDEPNPQVEAFRSITPVNVAALLVIPDYLSSYRVRVVLPKWFDEISLQIEGFIGTAANPSQPFILGL